MKTKFGKVVGSAKHNKGGNYYLHSGKCGGSVMYEGLVVNIKPVDLAIAGTQSGVAIVVIKKVA